MQQSPEERFDELYREHADAVRAYARRRSPGIAEDVAAETFLVCWRKLDDVPRNALPWLYAVARNVLANERRRQERVAPGERAEVAEPGLPSDPVLAHAFARLADDDREVLRLVAWEGLGFGDVAAALGCSRVACRVRFHRAKRRLAELLEQAPAASPRPRAEGVTR
jgi:RNA polymerase sigma-70 factor, ECF subfamily